MDDLTKEQIFEQENMVRMATISAASFNEEANTFTCSWGKGVRVKRYSWNLGEYYWEELVMDASAIRTERMEKGIPFLNNHNTWGLSSRLGTTLEMGISNGEGFATIKLSSRKDDEMEGIRQDIRDGIIKDISVGYRVHKYERIEEEGNKIPVYRAVDWEPMELSAVLIPADPSASIRSADEKKNSKTFTVEVRAAEARENNDHLPEVKPDKTDRSMKTDPKVETPGTDPDTEKIRKEAEENARKAERARITEIQTAGRKLDVSSERIQKAIDNGITANEFRKEIIEEWAKEDPHKEQRTADVRVTADERDKFRKVGSQALATAYLGEKLPEETGSQARELAGLSLRRFVEECMRAAGTDPNQFRNDKDLFKAAFGQLDGHRSLSISDFPVLLQETTNRSLRKAYELAAQTFRMWSRAEQVSDFRTVKRVPLGTFTPPAIIAAGMEYSLGSTKEGQAEEYTVAKYGMIYPLDWEAMVNDDLGAFFRMMQGIGNGVAQNQSDIVYSILSGNPTMGDGVALFHANHSNLAASGAAISDTTIAAARAAMRKQKTEGDGRGSGGHYLNLTPKYLLCGPDTEASAIKAVYPGLAPASASDVSAMALSGLAPEIISEARITGNEYYFIADPNRIDTVEYATLRGEPEIYSEQQTGFEVDGIKVKIRSVFGAKAIDYRGMYKNPGAP